MNKITVFNIVLIHLLTETLKKTLKNTFKLERFSKSPKTKSLKRPFGKALIGQQNHFKPKRPWVFGALASRASGPSGVMGPGG